MDANYNLGVSYQFWGKTNLAKDAYLNTLKTMPKHINSLNNLGVIYFNNQQLDSAMLILKLSYIEDSTNSNTLGNLGGVYHLKGDFKEAINFYEKSLSYDKNNKNSLTNLLKACQSINDTVTFRKYEMMMQ